MDYMNMTQVIDALKIVTERIIAVEKRVEKIERRLHNREVKSELEKDEELWTAKK